MIQDEKHRDWEAQPSEQVSVEFPCTGTHKPVAFELDGGARGAGGHYLQNCHDVKSSCENSWIETASDPGRFPGLN